MEYNKAFNTPMVIFTAFPGNLTSSMSGIGWVRVYSEHFGLPAGLKNLSVLSNGNSYICIGQDSSKQYVSRFDPYSGTWIPTFTMGFSYHLLSFSSGAYMWDVGSSIYSSPDGSSLNYSGYLPEMKNVIICAANNGEGAVASAWFKDTPLYVGSLGGGAWQLVGTFDKNGICCFDHIIYHSGMYVGIASDTITGSGKGGLMVSGSGSSWSRTLQYPIGHENDYYKEFSYLRSVNGKLFMTIGYRETYSSSAKYQLCLVDGGCSSYRVVKDITLSETSSLETIVYVPKLGMYLHFMSSNISVSEDGINWSDAPQQNFSGFKYKAAYIPNTGFYVTPGSNYIYFGAYK